MLGWRRSVLESGNSYAVFIEAVRRSSLVDEIFLLGYLKDFEQSCPADYSPEEKLRQLSAKLLGDMILTRWQCGKLMLGKHKGFIFGNYLLRDYLGVHVARKEAEAYVARDLREWNLEVVLEFTHFRQDLLSGRDPEFTVIYECRFTNELK
jgi:hypothetical protein